MIIKHSKIRKFAVLLTIFVIPLMLTFLPSNSTYYSDVSSDQNTDSDFTPGLSLPPTTYDWWNDSWDFRVPVGIEAIGGQQDAPVELFINFTEYFEDLNIQIQY